MIKFLMLLLVPVLLFAGRVSQWSGTFMFQDPAIFTQTDQVKDFIGAFDMVAQPNPFNPSTTLHISGILPKSKSFLNVYGIDGKLIADLSTLVHTGHSSVVWNAPGNSSSLLFAVLQNGNRTKTIKLILLK